MQIRWESDAVQDLTDLRRYIWKENPVAANSVANKIVAKVDLLQDHPLLGKAGRIYNTRELVISGTQYTVVYLAEAECVSVLRVFHQAMSWPESV